MRQVNALIGDETCTLREGNPAYYRAVAAPGWDDIEVLSLAASLDQGSEHPLADAIVRAAREQGLLLDKPINFESGTGIGVQGEVDGHRLALGNTALALPPGAAPWAELFKPWEQFLPKPAAGDAAPAKKATAGRRK